VQSVGVLALGSMAQISTSRRQEPARTDGDTKLPAIPAAFSPPVPASANDEQLTELRENYRSVREHARELQKRAGRFELVSTLMEAYDGSYQPLSALAQELLSTTGARGVSLYSYVPHSETMVVLATGGAVPKEIEQEAFGIPRGEGDARIRHRVDVRLEAIASGTENERTCSVLLKDEGRLVGMVALFDRSQFSLEGSEARVREAANFLAHRVAQEQRLNDILRRLRESETLYMVASSGFGAHTVSSLISRTLREIWGTVRLDHLAAYQLQGSNASRIKVFGAQNQLLQKISFASGQGVAGWVGIGSPEVCLFDAREDQRLEGNQAIRERVGSFAIIPVEAAGHTYGLITAATHRIGGLDGAQIETLRVVASELGQAIARFEAREQGSLEGLATPHEFQKAATAAGNGCLVYLEVLHREKLIGKHGRVPVDFAIRKFAMRLRSRLPQGGLLCRRSEGDFIAFLPDVLPSRASSWATEITATASMVAVTTPDGSTQIPLALRAKVAQLTSQKKQVSQEVPA
jgi:hypothetical protein